MLERTKVYNWEVHHPKGFDDICSENNVVTIEQALKFKELWNVNNGVCIGYRCHKDVEKLRKKIKKYLRPKAYRKS